MERHPKTRGLPKIRGRKHQTHPSALFSPIFSRAREKIGPPEARQKRPRRNESLQARLLILCARFFLSKPQTEFAVWVFSMQICSNLSVSAAPSQLPWKGSLGCVQNKKISPQKGADQQIWSAPSIDGNRSKATSCKSNTPVSGGAYQDARKVTTEWNDA